MDTHENGQLQDEPKKDKSYPYIGIRPIEGLPDRLEKVKAALKKRGRRESISSLVNQCIFAHLPALEKEAGVRN